MEMSWGRMALIEDLDLDLDLGRVRSFYLVNWVYIL